MKKIDQYNNFIESVYNKINKSIEGIHVAIHTKHSIFNFLKKHEASIRKSGIDFDKLKEFNEKDYNYSFSVNKNIQITDDEILNEIIHNNINTFLYLSYSKINTLLEYIEYMTYIYHIPYTIYSYLIKEFNTKIVETLINGGNYSFGFGLSNISIKRGKRRKGSKAIKWDETNRLKATGRKGEYKCYHESPYYNFFYWNKSKCAISNHKYYSFKVTSFTNNTNRRMNDYYNNVTSLNSIIEDDSIGNLQKLNACVKLNPECVNEYLNN